MPTLAPHRLHARILLRSVVMGIAYDRYVSLALCAMSPRMVYRSERVVGGDRDQLA
jgi:hypothetical protein